MWKCPDCGRNFRQLHQPHSCGIVPIEKHFIGKPEGLRLAFEKILAEVSTFGHIQVTSLNGAIMFAGASSFLAFKTRKAYAELELLSDTEINEFPVYKTIKVSKSRVALFVRIQSVEEVDQQLLRWIKNVWQAVGK